MKNEEVKFRLIKPFLTRSVFENMKKIYRKDELKKEIIKFYFSKIKSCLFIILLSIVFGIGVKISGADKQIKDGKIKRNNSGEAEKIVNVEVFSNGRKLEDKKLSISSKKYSDKEIEKYYLEFEQKIKTIIKGKNESLDYVVEDLVFKKTMDGFPFTISYKTDKPLIISSDGKVKADNIAEENIISGQIVEISVTAKYETFEETEFIYVQVFKKEKTGSEKLLEEIDTSIAVNEEITKTEDYFVLPVRAGEKAIFIKEKNNGTSLIIVILGIVASIVIYFGKDKEINDSVITLQKEMDLEYSLLVNKFALFYNANMPVKKIWGKICKDYEDEKQKTGNEKFVYEEMVFANNLMKEGMSEIKAYEGFAKRCSSHKYRILVNMLEQAVTKGKKDMSKLLIDEARDAFSEKKNNVKRLGEEAGTKLLIPMFMMLMIVMVMIIFPAFYSFKM